MEESLDDLYFNWLCAKVLLADAPFQSYFKLLHILHDTEYVWTMLGDDNRAEDGRELRLDFRRETGISTTQEFEDVDCSILEMLIALSQRAEFQTDLSCYSWFWIFIQNLGLAEASDDSRMEAEDVAEILNRFVWRNYERNGSGGLFPMEFSVDDQRKVEIWYQLAQYLDYHDIY
jgi:hypothetical protein